MPRLAARGYRVRAASRRREALEARGWDGVEIAEADALDKASLARALDGVEIAYYLVHSVAAGRDFAALDREAADRFVRAAERAGMRRIIYLGGLQPARAASPHLRSRRETGERLRAGAVPVTELRAGIVVGPGSAAFEVIRDLVYHLPVMVTPRWVRSRSQPIALDDLLEILELSVEPREGGSGVLLQAHFHPAGSPGCSTGTPSGLCTAASSRASRARSRGAPRPQARSRTGGLEGRRASFAGGPAGYPRVR